MGESFGGGYELLMVVWGTAFIVGAGAFIYVMNGVFQSEQRREDAAAGTTGNDHVEDHLMRPAA